MDYIAYDPATDRVWVPAGNTGTIQVIDVATGKVNVLASFPTAPPAVRAARPWGRAPQHSPAGTVWVGNRGDNQLLAFDGRTLNAAGKVHLEVMPDGLAYVGRKRELWATTPADHGIKVIDIEHKPHVVANIVLEGSPEGYAVDDEAGVFYTNLEDKDRTVAIDVRTRKVIGNWSAGRGWEGLRAGWPSTHVTAGCSSRALTEPQWPTLLIRAPS